MEDGKEANSFSLGVQLPYIYWSYLMFSVGDSGFAICKKKPHKHPNKKPKQKSKHSNKQTNPNFTLSALA